MAERELDRLRQRKRAMEREIEGIERTLQGLATLQVRHAPGLDRSKVLGFLHQNFEVLPQGEPWLAALSMHAVLALFNIVVADSETAKIMGTKDLLVNPPPGAVWFVQEDKSQCSTIPMNVLRGV